MSAIATLLLTLLLVADPAGHTSKHFKITVVDEQTGRGVPLLELRTVNNFRYWSNSNGIIAFYEPGPMVPIRALTSTRSSPVSRG